MFIETVEAIGTGISIFEISEKAFPTFRKIFSRLRHGELRIAIFGPGGTGKTTLGRILSGEFDTISLLSPYQESIRIEKYQLDGDIIGSVIVAPGQERRENTWDDILRLLTGGKVKIIINVVSWGYHSFEELSYKETKYYKDGMSIQKFVEEFSNDRRLRELEVIKRLTPYLSIADLRKISMITLVTKQDLWWKNRQQVKNHYMDGEYNNSIQEVMRRKGSENFIHEYLSASLVMNNFISGQKEPLVLTAEGYDQNLQMVNSGKLIMTIEKLVESSLGR